MGYASKVGRARVSAKSPSALAVCDRCGIWTNHNRLRWQFDWAGASLINKRILVCDTCEDVPQNQLRAIVLPADPTPIQNPRTQDYVTAETDYRVTSGQNTVNPQTGIPVPGGNTRITQDDNTRVIQETGEPPYGLNEFPGTILDLPGNALGPVGLPYGFEGIPETGPLPGVNYSVWLNYSINPIYWTPGPYESWNPPTTVILNWVYQPITFNYVAHVFWVNSINDDIDWTNNSSNDIYWD